MRQTLWLLCGVLVFCPAPLWAQKKNEVVVVFKNGWTVRGKVAQKTDMIVDPYSGKSFKVPAEGSSVYIYDNVRRIMFSPTQVQDIIEIKEPPKEFMVLHKPGSLKRSPMSPNWQVESYSDWSTDKWDRVLKFKTETGRLELVQRITDITPFSLHGFTVDGDWDFAYLVGEFQRDKVREFAEAQIATVGQLSDFQKRMNLAKFLQLAGWYDMADKELEVAALKFPGQGDAVKEYRAQVRKQQVEFYAGELERLQKTGMHEAVLNRIDQFKDEELSKLLSDKHRLMFQEMKLKYDGIAAQIAQVKQFLKDFPNRVSERKLWAAACKVILDELNPDTVERLTTFLRVAEPHAKELLDNRKPTQKTEEVLALAVSGWLQGDSAALPDAKAAANLFRAREFVLSYLRTDNAVVRSQLLASFTKRNDVPIDAVVQMLRLLPPTHAKTEKLETSEPTKMSIEVPDSEGGQYFLQLPPEYNPQRSYPVLVVLNSNREKADVLLKRWQSEAAKHGFILASPLWGQDGFKPVYQYSKAEHDVVLDTVRDLRRRFNVDSDRVFLFGWDQGGNAAFDIGLSHPDQFAGVLPMSGAVTKFTHCYWSNAQYLPFYVVEGDRNGIYPKAARAIFKEWVRGQYPAVYVEYRGRTSELFLGEFPSMMDWMSRTKRMHPTKALGRYHTAGGIGEEFKMLRTSDNRFYWLSTDEIATKYLSEQSSFTQSVQPATLTATMAVANVSDKSGARISTVFNIRTAGLRQVTLSLSPTQVDFAKPVSIRVDGRQIGGVRIIQPSLQTLLEELYTTGDRQRLVAARIEMRL